MATLQINRLPVWFKQQIPSFSVGENVRLLGELKVNTVCQEAHCPNLCRCLNSGELTFLILGPACTRSCRFCAVTKTTTGSGGVDRDEPQRIAEAVRRFHLDYAVLTSVTRDDLADGGAGHFARTIKAIRDLNPEIYLEALIPDFRGERVNIDTVISAGLNVLAHNLETVSRLSLELRPQAGYKRSLAVLNLVKQNNNRLITKSSLMLGLGETAEEVIDTMRDLRSVGCDILVLGQYLASSTSHYPVKEFIDIADFIEYKNMALSLGFKAVLSEPLARSSYMAEALYREAINA